MSSFAMAPFTLGQELPRAAEKNFDKAEEEVVVRCKKIIQQRKLRTIIIPKFEIEDVTLEEAINKLRILIRENDPAPKQEEKGISFVIRIEMALRPGEKGVEFPEIRIRELSLQNAPAEVVLRQICMLCNPRMRYKIEDFVVAIGQH